PVAAGLRAGAGGLRRPAPGPLRDGPHLPRLPVPRAGGGHVDPPARRRVQPGVLQRHRRRRPRPAVARRRRQHRGGRPMSAAVSPPRPALTRDAPCPERFYAWAQDRFPPPVAVVFLVMFGGGAFGAAIAAGEKPALSIGRVLGALALVAFYLGVRIYDEHKDYELDTRVHPDRLTVSGVMPLRDLRVVQAVGLVFQAAVCVAFDGGIGPV